MTMKRRNFLQSSLAAGAGIAVAQSRVAKARQDSAEDTINVGIIGVGAQGRVLLDSCVRMPNLNFKAVCDVWSFSQRYGQRYLMAYNHEPNVYTDYREMLEQETDLDAVIVATPDFVHAEQANACLKKGLHVYCEKMMSNDIEEARSMVKTMNDTGKLMQVGHQRRSNPRYIHVLNRLINDANLPGQITNINGHWNRSLVQDIGWPEAHTIPDDVLERFGYSNMHEFRNWRWYKRYGAGPISDLGAHQIDIYNWFLGAPAKSVLAGGGTDFYKQYEWYDNVMAIFEYDTPTGIVRASYQTLTTTSAPGGYSESFMGTDGTIKISENPNDSGVYREARTPESKWAEFVRANYIRQDTTIAPQEAESAQVDIRETAPLAVYEIPVVLNKPIHMPHLENFFNAVRGKAELTCPADKAFESEVPVFKVNDAVQAKRMIELTDEDYAV